jgi:tRNA dimethylallyltransferase
LKRHFALVGPTASGKSAVALELAQRLDLEIVSADSMQVYREMDIGTAKPTVAERNQIRHHLIDVADPSEDFSVARYQQLTNAALADIEGRGRQALLVGGTGLYVQAVVDGLALPGQFPDTYHQLDVEPDTAALFARLQELDPAAATKMEPTNRRRILRALEVTIGSGRPFSSYGPGVDAFPTTRFVMGGLAMPRSTLNDRIQARVDAMVAAGLIDEVKQLANRPDGLSRTARQALGYQQLLAHVEDDLPLDTALDEVVRWTRRLAKRQQSWFGRDPRVTWYEADGNPLDVVPALLGDWSKCR